MFRSKSTIKSSQIHDDVADLINELDRVAAPFDESSLIERAEDDLIVEEEDHRPRQYQENLHDDANSPILSSSNMKVSFDSAQVNHSHEDLIRIVLAHSPRHEASALDDRNLSRDSLQISQLSMQASDLTTSQLEEELALMEESIHDMPVESNDETRPSPIDHSLFRHDVRPAFFEEAPVSNQVDPRKEAADDGFNPFVNIGNRLMDSQDATSQDANNGGPDGSPTSVYYKVLGGSLWMLKLTVKIVWTSASLSLQLLLGLMQILSFRSRRLKLVAPALVLVVILYTNNAWTTHVQQQDEAPATIVADLAWNASLLEDISTQVQPTLIMQEEESPFQRQAQLELFVGSFSEDPDSSKVQELLDMLKVLALYVTVSVTGLSLLRLGTKSSQSADGKTEVIPKSHDRSHYENLTLAELKQELSSRSLKTTGIHSHLVDRLVDNDRGERIRPAEVADYDISAIEKHLKWGKLKVELRSRGLLYNGIKEDLIVKVWIPARMNELKLCKRDELRKMLKSKNLGQHGLKDDLVRRLIEAGH